MIGLLLLVPPPAASQTAPAVIDLSTHFQAIHALQAAGHEAFERKEWGRAAQFYHQYLRLSPQTTYHEDVVERLFYAERLLAQHSETGFTLLAYPQQEGMGIGIHDYMKDALGMYISARVGNIWFLGDPLQYPQMEEEFEFPEGQEQVEKWSSQKYGLRYTRTGDHEHVNAVGTVGVTRKLIYPFWLNIGVSGAYQQKWDRIEHQRAFSRSDPDWQTLRDQYLRDLDAPTYVFGGEAGITWALGGFSLQYGISYVFGRPDHYFGFGADFF